MPTYTALGRLPIMQPGDPSVAGSWGTIVNSAWSCVEQLAAGISTIDLSGQSNYTLSTANDAADQARPSMLSFIGTPIGTCRVTLPPVARVGFATNNTTNPVTLFAGGTTTLTIPTSATVLYGCDGANVISYSLLPPGQFVLSSGAVVNNATYYSGKLSTGATQPLIGISASDNTNLYNVGGSGHSWRVLNQAGTTALLSIDETGAASFAASVSVAGTLTSSGLLTTATGLTSTGYDAGGLQTRVIGGTYGAGWRNDGTNFLLLTTNAAAPTGTYNSLRPFYVALANGAVRLDGTGAGTSCGGALAVTGAVTAASVAATSAVLGGVTLSGGTATATNFTASSTVAGNIGNFSSSTIFGNLTVNATATAAQGTFTNATITSGLGVGANLTSPAATITTLNCTNLTASNQITAVGNLVGAGVVVANAAVSNTVTAQQLTSNGNANIAGTLYASGATSYSAGGYGMVPAVVAPTFATVATSIIASSNVGAAGFFTSSDRRLKTQITDISAEDAIDWITRGRPRTYIMDGHPQAGFVAQEDVEAGRYMAISALADDRPECAKGDGIAPPGARLVRRYETDIAYLTAALQDCFTRITALEAQLQDQR